MLTGKVAVVTGAGSGLGRALCKRFCEEGCNVVGLGRMPESLEETAALVDSELFSFRIVDVCVFHSVSGVFSEIVKTLGQVDYLFNNAAVYPKVSFLDESAEEWSAVIDTNVNGPANCCKAVLPHMIERGFGRIYNVGSFADLGPIERSAAYSCSKGALHALARAIMADLRELNVAVEVHEWVPGHLNTQMSGFTGLDPSIPAGWAIDMVMRPASPGRGLLFEQDREFVPPRGMRAKIRDLVFFWRRNRE